MFANNWGNPLCPIYFEVSMTTYILGIKKASKCYDGLLLFNSTYLIDKHNLKYSNFE